MTLINQNTKTQIGDFIMKITLCLYRISNMNIIYKSIFIIYNYILNKFNISILPIVNAEIYKSKTNNIHLTLIDENRKGISANIIMATKIKGIELKSHDLPNIYLKKINNVCIQGNSDAIIDANNKYLIYEKAYNTDYREKIIDGLLYRTLDNVALVRNNLKNNKEEVSSGIMISGKFCTNYYHIVFENLIRLIYLEKVNIPPNVPILIDQKTIDIPSCKKIFDILTENTDREIIFINSDTMYLIKELYYIDHINKIPSHSKDPLNPSLVIYNPDAIIALRNKLLNYKSKKDFNKRIFISRKKSKRRHYNEDEIYNMLKKYNFERISPEEYCFEDQITLFNNAEFIISSSGAALTNLLFINQNCTVICFGRSSYNEEYEIPIFNTIANINGAKFYYFPRKSKVNNDVHIDFEVNSKDLEKTINTLLNI